MKKTKKEKQLEKQEKELKKKYKSQEKSRKRREKIEAKAVATAATLKAFKSISGVGEAISFVFVYGKPTVLILVAFVLGYVFRHYGLFSALFKKFGLITEIVK